MSEVLDMQAEQFLQEPCLWVDVAHTLAAEGKEEVPAELMQKLEQIERPIIRDPRSCRKAFWRLLAEKHRHIGIGWLHETDLLREMIPCWTGNEPRQRLRLAALEQVHLESWRTGISDTAFNLICEVHDVVVDRRLNRWALTALGTLLAGGDTENQKSWGRQVRVDLHNLGATEAELVWIDRVVLDFNAAILYLKGLNDGFSLRPETAVAALSTLQISDSDLIDEAAVRADESLRKRAES
jgi:hypothetical protein